MIPTPRASRPIFAIVAILTLSTACATVRQRWQPTWPDPWRNGWLDPGEPVVAQTPPAAEQLDSGPIGVGTAGQVWVEGHYEWVDQHYTWIAGHWATPPQTGWTWQQPAFHNGRWRRGYWHTRNAQVDPSYLEGQGAWNPGWHGDAHSTPVAHPVTLSTSQSTPQPVATPSQ